MNHHALRIVVAAICACAPGCERPAPLPPEAPITPPAAPALSHAREAMIADRPTSGNPVAPAEVQSPAPRDAGSIVASYRVQMEVTNRHALVAELSDLPPAKGVAAVGELLAFEKRPELREALLDTLDAFAGEEAAKVALLRTELLENRTGAASRDAAIDALLNIQHRAALPLWKALLEDADEETRDVARQAIAALESL
jgi:hypothetical protein